MNRTPGLFLRQAHEAASLLRLWRTDRAFSVLKSSSMAALNSATTFSSMPDVKVAQVARASEG